MAKPKAKNIFAILGFTGTIILSLILFFGGLFLGIYGGKIDASMGVVGLVIMILGIIIFAISIKTMSSGMKE